jgi:hypothetical protein
MKKSTAFVLREQGAGLCLNKATREAIPLNKNYFGIRYDPGMFSSNVANTAAFAVASLLK